MNANVIPAEELACQLLDAASGIPADVAAAGLIISHGHFLHRDAFRRIIRAGTGISTGQPLAVIGWDAALCALEAGQMPCASSERAILRIAASLGDPEIPVRLRTVLGNLDTRNITLVAGAITTLTASPSSHPESPAASPPRLAPQLPERPGPHNGCRTPCRPLSDLPAAPDPLTPADLVT